MVQRTIDVIVSGGIAILEITTNTPGFAEEIKRARHRHPGALIGAGTVINVDLAKQAIAHGAQFLVTPNTNREVAEICKTNGVPLVMGAMTPTEVADALAFGADIVKLFPAGELGITYFKSLKGPFDTVPFFAVGGIDEDNISDWFKAGVDGVGLGSCLVNGNAETDSDFNGIAIMAKKLINSLAKDNG